MTRSPNWKAPTFNAQGRIEAVGSFWAMAYPSLAKVAARGEAAAEPRAADLVAKLKEPLIRREFTARELDVIQTGRFDDLGSHPHSGA